MASTPEPFEVLFVATLGDTAMIEAIEQQRASCSNVRMLVIPPNRRGDYAKKINRAVEVTSAPFLFLGADDLRFHPGWLPAALVHFDDPAVGVVGTQDLAPTERSRSGQHSTHSLVRRSYVERFGTIDEPGKVLHEGYWHEFVDDELVGTAKARGAWRFAHRSVVEHLHPSWGKAEFDRLYREQDRRMAVSRRLYQQRRRLWENPARSRSSSRPSAVTSGGIAPEARSFQRERRTRAR